MINSHLWIWVEFEFSNFQIIVFAQALRHGQYVTEGQALIVL